MPLLLYERDETILPAVCYDICNNAYLEAQKAGKTPALCAKNSPFLTYYTGCDRCIQDVSDKANQTGVYLDPKFAEFTDFCVSQGNDLNTIMVSSFLIPTTMPTATAGPLVRTLWGTTTLAGGAVVSVAVTDTITLTALDPFTSQPSQAGKDNSTRTSAPTESPAGSRPITTAGLPSSSATPDGTSSSSGQPSTAIIAGAVVGGLAALVLALFIIFYLRRRKKNKHQPQTEQPVDGAGDQKAQLHGDSMVPKNPPQEMSTQANTAEMEANDGAVYQYDEAKGVYVLTSPGPIAQPYPAELYGSEILPFSVPVVIENPGDGGLNSRQPNEVDGGGDGR